MTIGRMREQCLEQARDAAGTGSPYSGECVSLRLRARYAGDGYEADDPPFLAGMDAAHPDFEPKAVAIGTPQLRDESNELRQDMG